MSTRSHIRVASLAALLLGAVLAAPSPRAHADATVTYHAISSPEQDVDLYNSEGEIHIKFTINGGTGSAALVTNVPQTLSIGDTTLDVNSFEYQLLDDELSISRPFIVGGITHTITQVDDLSGYDDNSGIEGIVDVHAGPTVTFDLGLAGQVDVTPQEYKYDLRANPTAPAYKYTFLLRPPAAAPVSVAVSPGMVTYPAPAQGTVTLAHPAPTGGEDVLLTSSDPTVTVPSVIHAAAGATSVTFLITTSRVDVDTPVTLTAMSEQISASTTFTVLTRPETTFQYSLADLPDQEFEGIFNNSTLDFSITGGSGSVGLALGIPYTITIGSYNLDASFGAPDTLVVTDVPFSRDFALGGIVKPLAQTIVRLDAELDDYYDYSFSANIGDPDPDPLIYHLGNKGIVTVSAPGLNASYPPLNTPIPVTFTLLPNYPVTVALAVNPYKLYGGATTYGRVRLDAHAPSGGIVVSLTSSDPGIASVPATVTVPAGALSATFPVTTYAQDGDATASITATSGGYSAKTHVDVLAGYSISGTILDQTGASRPGVLITAKTRGNLLLTSTATPHASIPDGNASGLTSTLSPLGSGMIDGISVGLNITHPNVGDLMITLTGPGSISVVLQNPSDSTQQNLTTSYPILTTPVQRLTAFVGKAVHGTWTLKVVDTKTGNVGTLNDWSLTFNYAGSYSTSTTTAQDGTYTVTELKEDSLYGAEYYSVTPTLTGYNFSPGSQSVRIGPGATPPNPDGIDFTGTPQ